MTLGSVGTKTSRLLCLSERLKNGAGWRDRTAVCDREGR